MAKYIIKSKYKECLPLDEWITKLEMRAFGWVYRGIDVTYFDSYDISIDWDTGKGTATQNKRVDNTFKRIEPYSYNIIFNLLEILMSIQSWIRRKLIALFFGLVLISVGIGILTQDYEILGVAAAVVAFIYLPSLNYALLGFLTRKIFRLDEKLKDRLEQNGYEREQDV